MKPAAILIIGAALPVSIAVSFFSRRFWLGFLLPLGGLAVYLVLAAFHATGWKLDQIGLPLAFSIALMLTLGLPMSAVSGIGAWFGLYLSKRRFSTEKAPENGD
jgi:hypothetical protein